MGSKAVVQTVMIINREDNANVAARIFGTDLYVGDNSLPYQNTPCGANPLTSGVYSCGGKIGKYLGLYKNVQVVLNISQIRAYSYTANAYSNYQYLTSPITLCSSASNLDVWTGRLLDVSCKMPVGGNPAYYNIVFDVERYVHAVTLVGNQNLDFQESRNWFVKVGSATGASITGNTEYGRYVNFDFDRHGKEIRVGAYGKSVGVYRQDGVYLSFRWIAVFTTKTDCSGPFDWSGSQLDWRIRLTGANQDINGLIFAKIYDCAVFHGNLVLADGSPLPNFMTYDVYTKGLTINISASQVPVKQTVKACAYLNDRVTTAKSECKEIQVDLYRLITSLAFTPQTFNYQHEENTSTSEFALPTITWGQELSLLNLQWTLQNAPNFVHLVSIGSSAKVQIDSTAFAGNFPHQVVATDTYTQISATLNAILVVYSCNPTGFTISQSSLTLEIEGASQSLNWIYNSLNSGCGTYSAVVDSAFSHFLIVTGQQITAQAPATAQVGTSNPIITLHRDSNTAQKMTAQLSLVVYSCNPTSFTISPSSLTLEIEGASQSLNWTQNSLNSACGTYSVVVDSALFYLLTVTGQQIFAQAPATAQVATFNPKITLRRDSNTAQKITAQLSLVVKRPQITALTLVSEAKIKATYTIGKSAQKITFPKYSCLPKGCVLDLEYVVALISKKADIRFTDNPQLNKQTTLLPSLLKWNPTEFIIQGSDYQEAWNAYLVRVVAIEKTDPQFQDSSFLLEVETSVDCVTDVELSVPDSFSKEISYAIVSLGQPTVYLYPKALDSVSSSTGISQICGPVACVVNQTDSIGSQSNPLPSFIKFSQPLMSLSINTTDSSNSGTYDLLFDYFLSYFVNNANSKHKKQMVKLTTLSSQLKIPAFLDQIIPNSTSTLEPIEDAKTQISEIPEIQQPIIEQASTEFVIYASEKKEIIIGKIKDDGSTVTLESIKISCGIPNEWIKLPETTDSIKDIRLIVNVPTDVQDDTCELQFILVQLKDTAQQSLQLKTKLKIVSQTFKGFQAPVTVNERAQVDIKSSPVISKSTAQQDGTSTIEFNQDIFVPQDIYNMTSENGGSKYFNMTLVVHEANLEAYAESNNQQRRLLSQNELHGFKWSIIKAKRLNQIKFEFVFNNPQIISVHGSDKIIIDLVRNGLITSPDQQNAVIFKPQAIVLPTQIASKQEVAEIKVAVQSVSSGMQVFLSGNFFLTAFTSIVIYYLWGMINSLQLIALTCLFKIRLPANIFAFNKEILKLANFDLFQTEWLIQKVFRFSESTSFLDSFDQAGYGGSNFIIGIGMMGISIFLYILFIGMRETVLRWFHDEQYCLQKIYPWFKSHNVELTTIRFVLEGTMDVLFWALISILHVRDTRSLGPKFSDKFSNLLAIAFLLLIIYAPMHAIYRATQLNRLMKKKKQGVPLTAKLKQQTATIRLLFEDFNDNLPSLSYNLIFIVRRSVLVTTLIFLPNYGNFQVSIYLLSAFFMALYTTLVKPYKNETLNKQEISNEFFILASSYFMLIFSGWIPDDQLLTGTNLNLKNTMGRVMFALISLNIFTNIAIIGRALAMKAKSKLRERQVRKLHMEQIEIKASIQQKQTKIQQKPAFNIDEAPALANNIQLANDDCQIVSINLDELIHGKNKDDCSPAESSLEDSEESQDSDHENDDDQVKEDNNKGSKNEKKMKKQKTKTKTKQVNAEPAIEKTQLELKKKPNNQRRPMTKDQSIPLRNQRFKQRDFATGKMKVITNWEEFDDCAYVEWEDEEEKVPQKTEQPQQSSVVPLSFLQRRKDYPDFCKYTDEYNRETLKRDAENEAQRVKWEKSIKENNEALRRYRELFPQK